MRKIAKAIGLVTADKKDSQGLCFVGKVKLQEFLQQQLKTKNGKIIEVPNTLSQYENSELIHPSPEHVIELAEPYQYSIMDGQQVASHNGAHFYTIGQRKGLHVGGRPKPRIVIGIDTKENVVYTGQTDRHPGLNRRALKIKKDTINWINKRHNTKNSAYSFRIRYRQALQKGILIQKNKEWYILFDKKQKAISPGQFAAWYSGDILIGSGVIDH